MSHIGFEGISCKALQYIRTSNSWVCLDMCTDLKYADTCMRCKFSKQLYNEKQLLKGGISGKKKTRY